MSFGPSNNIDQKLSKTTVHMNMFSQTDKILGYSFHKAISTSARTKKTVLGPKMAQMSYLSNNGNETCTKDTEPCMNGFSQIISAFQTHLHSKEMSVN